MKNPLDNSRIFAAEDFAAWIDRMAREIFGMPGPDFLSAYHSGDFRDSTIARHVASVEILTK